MKMVLFICALIVGGMMYLHESFQNGTIIGYIDKHQHERFIPQSTYYIGTTYYLFQNLPEATTYFLRVAQRYPDGLIGDEGYFNYLQCLDDTATIPRENLIEGYRAYLEKYPHGKHAEVIQSRLDGLTTGGH